MWLETIGAVVSTSPDLAAAAAGSGPALPPALFTAAHRSCSRPDGAAHGAGGTRGELEEPSLVISVGDAVRRAVPTAARATLSARAPLRSGLTEAQVGGPFGRALGAHTDALVLLGRAAETCVIGILESGEVEVQGATADQVALGASARARSLCGASNRTHSIVTGPGAQAGLPFANLASFDGGDATAAPSVVGRGGLGAVLAGTGVMALTVEETSGGADELESGSEPARSAPDGIRGIDSAGSDTAGSDLESSDSAGSDSAGSGPAGRHPAGREAAQGDRAAPGRAAGPDPFASEARAPRRGEPLEAALVRSPRLLSRAAGGTLELAASRGSALAVDGPRRKHGCAGCPTPCGWTFEVEGRGTSRVGGRFSALQGFAGRGEPLELLEQCNRLGVDARSVAGLMGRFPSVPPEAFFSGLLDPSSEVHVAALEGVPLAEAGATFARGDLAAEVGQALAVRGPEPLRSLSILGLDGERAREVIAPLPWAGDRERDAGTLAFWHECVAAAVDVAGFCSFSAAGLLADGVMGVSELGEALGFGPEGGASTAAVFLRSGARHLALHRELKGAEGAIPADLLERHPAAVEAYLAARDGRVAGDVVRGAAPTRGGRRRAGSPAASGDPAMAHGPLTVLARGPLGARLAGHPGTIQGGGGGPAGDEVRVELAVPPSGWTAREVLGELAAGCPAAAPWLLDPGGRPLPAVLEVEPGAAVRVDGPAADLAPGLAPGPAPDPAPGPAPGALSDPAAGTAVERRHGPGAAIELVLAIPGG